VAGKGMSKSGLGRSRRILFHATIGELRWQLRTIDDAIAALSRLSDERRADSVAEISPRLVPLNGTGRSRKRNRPIAFLKIASGND
jgi:hypothetical protein